MCQSMLSSYIPIELRELFGVSEFRYPFLIFCLFVIPRFLARYKIPLAVSAFSLGVFVSLGFDVFDRDSTVRLLSSLGITSLFLFAGLEVNLKEAKKHFRVLTEHLVIKLGLLVGAVWLLNYFLPLQIRPAVLYALALLTPSTGFILDSLDSGQMPSDRVFWIKAKAIAAEIIALVAMFFTVKSASAYELSISLLALIVLVLFLPIVFHFFAKRIAPYAPRSEFGFLLMVAIIAGMVTKKLGVYYLVGAFLVGLVAKRFEEALPDLASRSVLRSLKRFASFFTPFYFFQVGLGLTWKDFTWAALGAGCALSVVFIPIRVLVVVLHRKLSLKESILESFPVSTSLLPTLVFGFVLAGMLRDLFKIPSYLFGGLIFYTIATTVLPPLILRLVFKRKDAIDISLAHGDLG